MSLHETAAVLHSRLRSRKFVKMFGSFCSARGSKVESAIPLPQRSKKQLIRHRGKCMRGVPRRYSGNSRGQRLHRRQRIIDCSETVACSNSPAAILKRPHVGAASAALTVSTPKSQTHPTHYLGKVYEIGMTTHFIYIPVLPKKVSKNVNFKNSIYIPVQPKKVLITDLLND